ncbi:hypothetical protein HK102_008321 [Quaeritorhiza haematococci]|nr:hypothetical protein HK102_008321 [Quaeritorhiza haematococci]
MVAIYRPPPTSQQGPNGDLKQEEQIILVLKLKNAGSDNLESTTGLIDAGEDTSTAALRELKEETGYMGTILPVDSVDETGGGGPIAYEPGLTSSCSRVVRVDVDGSLEENRNPQQKRDEEEWSLRAVGVPVRRIWEGVRAMQQLGILIDSRLYGFAMGMKMAEEFRQGSV